MIKRVVLMVSMALAVQAGALELPLGLGEAANVTLDDPSSNDGAGGWTDEGPENSLFQFPTGRQEFSGILFDIPTSGNAVVALRGNCWPEAPTDVTFPVDGVLARTLFVLSSHAWTDADVELAKIRVRYRGGLESVFPLVLNRHTGPWWYPSGREAASVAWRGENRQGVPVGVYLAGFPLLDHPVDEVAIEANAMDGQLFVLGLTLSDIPPSALDVGSRWETSEEDRSSWFVVRFGPRDTLPAFDTRQSGVFGRKLWMELSADLSAPPEGEVGAIVNFLSALGYSGARLAPLDLLASQPGGVSAVGNLSRGLQNAGLAFSFGLAGGKSYHESDGVAAYRELDPRAGEFFFVDSAATASLHANIDRFANDGLPPGLGSSTLLRDSGFFSYHMDDLTRPHRRMLINQWSEWLKRRYQNQEGIEKAWQVAGEPPALFTGESLMRSKMDLLSLSQVLAAPARFRPRISDQITFLESLQLEWFLEQKAYAGRILPPAMWSTTAWVSPGWLQDIQTGMAASLDFVELSQERILPRVASAPGESQFSLDSPFTEEGLKGFLAPYYRVAGKPFVIWDATAAWPGDREFLHPLRTFLMAALQGWDGIVHRILTTLDPPLELTAVPLGPGPALQNPSVLAMLPLGRNLYLRGDVEALPVILKRPLLTAESLVSNLPRVPSLRDPLGPDYPSEIPFIGSVEAGRNLPAWRDLQAVESFHKGSPVQSVSRQVSLDPASDFLRIQSARSIAIAGDIDGRNLASDGWEIRDIKGYGLTYATSLDSKPLADSGSVLVGLIGKSTNTGTVFEKCMEPRGVLGSIWRFRQTGHGPVIMSPVRATLVVKSKEEWSITPLDPYGRRLDGSPPRTRRDGDFLVVEFDNAASEAPLFLLKKQ